MPFKNIKDIIKKITTCYSVATKDNKRNGIELWQGRTGLNMRKNFLTAKVIKHRKGKLEAIRDALWGSFKKQNSLATIWGQFRYSSARSSGLHQGSNSSPGPDKTHSPQ